MNRWERLKCGDVQRLHLGLNLWLYVARDDDSKLYHWGFQGKQGYGGRTMTEAKVAALSTVGGMLRIALRAIEAQEKHPLTPRHD